MILPHSNADVERVFSAMNCAKHKLRNRMKTNLLNALLSIKFGLIRRKRCGMSYKLPDSVVKKISLAEEYTNPSEADVETTSMDDDTSFEMCRSML